MQLVATRKGPKDSQIGAKIKEDDLVVIIRVEVEVQLAAGEETFGSMSGSRKRSRMKDGTR